MIAAMTSSNNGPSGIGVATTSSRHCERINASSYCSVLSVATGPPFEMDSISASSRRTAAKSTGVPSSARSPRFEASCPSSLAKALTCFRHFFFQFRDRSVLSDSYSSGGTTDGDGRFLGPTSRPPGEVSRFLDASREVCREVRASVCLDSESRELAVRDHHPVLLHPVLRKRAPTCYGRSFDVRPQPCARQFRHTKAMNGRPWSLITRQRGHHGQTDFLCDVVSGQVSSLGRTHSTAQ